MFDKLMFFEFENMSDEDFQKGPIKIEIFDYNMFSSNELIGQTDFQCGPINMSPGHEKYKTWACLFNPDKGLEPQGFL